MKLLFSSFVACFWSNTWPQKSMLPRSQFQKEKPELYMKRETKRSIWVYHLGILQLVLIKIFTFTIFLVAYICTLGGNTFIILVTMADPCLHTPMYFFLENLAFLDIYTPPPRPPDDGTSTIREKSISYLGCVVQLFAFFCCWVWVPASQPWHMIATL